MTDICRHGSTIFCDDIRFEVGNKTTFVGTYVSDMCVFQFPITLPKFCIYSRVCTPHGHRFGKQVTFRVYKDDEVIAQGIIENDMDPSGEGKSADSVQMMHATFFMSPLTIEKPCVIKVRAYDADGDEIKIGGLRVQLAPQGDKS